MIARTLLMMVATCILLTFKTGWAAPNPSFDCRLAHTQVEKRICSNTYLADADQWLAKTFQLRITQSTPEERNALLTEERTWLKGRNECLERDAPDVIFPEQGNSIPCLAGMYDLRITQLEAPYQHFADLSEDVPEGTDILSAVNMLVAKKQERLIALHQVTVQSIDTIADQVPSDVTNHLRRYVDQRAWAGTQWDERDLTGERWTINVSAVSLFASEPPTLVLSTNSRLASQS